MADERYQWLDPEAAERLLRGEPVDAVDPSARAGADALSDALAAARTAAAPAPGVPLAGEEAALAAFRTATAARAAATAAPDSAATADLGRVRLTTAPARSRQWGRSLRYGLAAALAAVTVGGVAVAASTGVLPLTEEPTRTVTAAETATPPEPSAPSAPTPAIERHDDPSRGADPGTPTETTAPGASPTGRSGDGTTTSPRPDVTTPGADRPDRGPAGPTATSGTGGGREAMTAACRDYRSGRLDATARRRLVELLRSEEPLRAYCDRLLGGGTTGDTDRRDTDPGDTDQGDTGSTGEKDGDTQEQEKDGTTDGNTDGRKDEGEDGDSGDRNRPDLSHGTVPVPTDATRKRGRAGPDPKDRPRGRTKHRPTVSWAPVTTLALCPTGAPETGV
ncbi:hypothetical protein ACFYOG_01015 [Streptomyces sp. NPDC007818]|uniref:hypothetical protein n=1 Tax=Streptomyces sp. NPDC007818 TaxID=3364780 RepID=UPI0036BD65FF